MWFSRNRDEEWVEAPTLVKVEDKDGVPGILSPLYTIGAQHGRTLK